MFVESEYDENVKSWVEYMNKFTEFQMLQDKKSGEIYALNTAFMEKALEQDPGKEVMGVLPSSWGSIRVAQIDSNDGSLSNINRMVTQKDI